MAFLSVLTDRIVFIKLEGHSTCLAFSNIKGLLSIFLFIFSMIKTRNLHTFSMITNVKSYTFSRIRIKNSCTNPRVEMCFVKYLLLFASFVDENLQNDIPRFWSTFLVHLFFPFCPLLHSVKIR